MLKVKNLVKSYSNQRVLSNITFDVCAGERVAILGAKGSGKRTLIRSICRLTKCDSGSIFFENGNLHNKTIQDTSVGIVLQGDGNLNSRMSTYENAMYLGSLRGLDRVKCSKSINKLAHRLGLENCQNYEVSSLSLEYRQRAAIVCAFVHDPTIVIIDMPELSLCDLALPYLSQNIDLSMKPSVQILIVTTNDMDYLSLLCDRVILLNKGELLFDGSFADFERDLHKYELRLSMSAALLARIEVQLMSSWKADNIFWRVDRDILVLNYSEPHQVLSTLDCIYQQSELPVDLTIESIPLEKTYQQFL